MDFGIAGKTALVSGGSKGIGRAIAEDLAREGVRVMITARGQEAIDAAVAEINAAGGTAAGIAADMTTKAGVIAAIEQTRGRLRADRYRHRERLRSAHRTLRRYHR